MFDVALFSALTLDLLVKKEGKIKAETRTPILSAGIGVAVRRGAPKPDIARSRPSSARCWRRSRSLT